MLKWKGITNRLFSLCLQTFSMLCSTFLIKPIVLNLGALNLKRCLEAKGEYIEHIIWKQANTL